MDNILGCFFSGQTINHDSSAEDIQHANSRVELFRRFLWDQNGLCELIRPLKSKNYGQNLNLILFQFYINPIPFELQNLKEIERFRRKEKSIGIPIIIDENNFFCKPDKEKLAFVKSRLIEKLDLVDNVVKRNKLDTNLNKLKADLALILGAETGS